MNTYLITGATGFLGQNLLRAMPRNVTIHRPRRSEADLTKGITIPDDVTHVIHCAADVGGISYNLGNGMKVTVNNLLMTANLMAGVLEAKNVKHVTLVGSACAYPLLAPVPLREQDLWYGLPEPSNGGYGIAKRINDVLAAQDCPFSIWHPVLANMYGPHDNFGKDAHVIPNMIEKMDIAVRDRREVVNLFGDGTPTRDFLYVQDAARYLVRGAEDGLTGTMNIGSGEETSISDLASMVAKVVNFSGVFSWSGDKNGQPRRCLDTSKIDSLIKLTRTPLYMGLMQTYAWWRTTQ